MQAISHFCHPAGVQVIADLQKKIVLVNFDVDFPCRAPDLLPLSGWLHRDRLGQMRQMLALVFMRGVSVKLVHKSLLVGMRGLLHHGPSRLGYGLIVNTSILNIRWQLAVVKLLEPP